MREEVTDRYGNVIYLTDERWQHIVEGHARLDGHRAEILSTVRSGKRRRSPYHPDPFFYKKTFRHLKGRLNKIEVVVVFHWQGDKPNNFVVTAYPA
jgi:hypothetical protein